MPEDRKHIPLLLYPFYLIWRLVVWVIKLTGRLVGAILGLVLLIVGIVVSLTIVGAVVGVPLAIFGFLLIMRSLF